MEAKGICVGSTEVAGFEGGFVGEDFVCGVEVGAERELVFGGLDLGCGLAAGCKGKRVLGSTVGDEVWSGVEWLEVVDKLT